MSKFEVDDYIIVRDDIDNVPKEWRGKKGRIIAKGVVKSTVGFRSVGEALSAESNAADVFRAHYVLMDGSEQSVPIDEAWLQLVKE